MFGSKMFSLTTTLSLVANVLVEGQQTQDPATAPCMCTGYPGSFCGIRYIPDSDFKYLDGDYHHPNGGCNPNALYFCSRNNPYGVAEELTKCPQSSCRKNIYDYGGHDDCMVRMGLILGEDDIAP